MNISRNSKNIFFYYIFVLLLWTFFFITGKASANGEITLGEALYQFTLGLIPLIGGILGLSKSKIWGRTKSYVGRALLCKIGRAHV